MSDDGGPAFPSPRAYKGMTLRDYFAGQALIAYLSAENARAIVVLAKEQGHTVAEVISATCYQMADAMLKERSK